MHKIHTPSSPFFAIFSLIFRLLNHGFAIICRNLVINKAVLEPQVSLLSRSHTFTIIVIWVQLPWDTWKNVETVTVFQNLTKGSMTPRWPLTLLLLRSHVWLYPRIIFIQVPWKYVKVCGYGDLLFFSKTWTKGHWPLDDIWPQVCWGHMCDSTLYPRIIVSKSHENTSKYVDTVTLFSKLEPKVIDP